MVPRLALLVVLLGCYESHRIETVDAGSRADTGRDASELDAPSADVGSDAPDASLCRPTWSSTLFEARESIALAEVGPDGPQIVVRRAGRWEHQHLGYVDGRFVERGTHEGFLQAFSLSPEGELFATHTHDDGRRIEVVRLADSREERVLQFERERGFSSDRLEVRMTAEGPAFALLADVLVVRSLHPRDGYELRSIHRGRFHGGYGLTLDPRGDLFFASQPTVYDEADPIRVLLDGRDLRTVHNPRDGQLALRYEVRPEMVYAGRIEGVEDETELVHVDFSTDDVARTRIPRSPLSEDAAPQLSLEADAAWALLEEPLRIYRWRYGEPPQFVHVPAMFRRANRFAVRNGWIIITGTVVEPGDVRSYVLVHEPCDR